MAEPLDFDQRLARLEETADRISEKLLAILAVVDARKMSASVIPDTLAAGYYEAAEVLESIAVVLERFQQFTRRLDAQLEVLAAGDEDVLGDLVSVPPAAALYKAQNHIIQVMSS